LYLILVPNNFLGRKEKQEGHFVSAIFYVENRDFHLKLNFLYQIDGEIFFLLNSLFYVGFLFSPLLFDLNWGLFGEILKIVDFRKVYLAKLLIIKSFFEMKDF